MTVRYKREYFDGFSMHYGTSEKSVTIRYNDVSIVGIKKVDDDTISILKLWGNGGNRSMTSFAFERVGIDHHYIDGWHRVKIVGVDDVGD